jgi:endonuclease/exonuclease/phosphatase family metal-dependent hydrolase
MGGFYTAVVDSFLGTDAWRCAFSRLIASSLSRVLAYVAFASAACMFGCQAASEEPVRLVTFNVLGCRGFPAERGGPIAFPEPSSELCDVLAERITAWRADVVVLQEAPPEAVVRQLSERLGMNVAWFPGQVIPGPEWPFGFPGAILSRFEIERTADRASGVRASHDVRFERHWGDVDLNVRGETLRIAGLHLCADWGRVFRESTRLAELEAVLAGPMPDVIAGDLNCVPTQALYGVLRKRGWRDAWIEANGTGAGFTSDTRRLHQRIDYVWLSPQSDWRATAVQVGDDAPTVVAGRSVLLSDHRPVLVELRPGRKRSKRT